MSVGTAGAANERATMPKTVEKTKPVAKGCDCGKSKPKRTATATVLVTADKGNMTVDIAKTLGTKSVKITNVELVDHNRKQVARVTATYGPVHGANAGDIIRVINSKSEKLESPASAEIETSETSNVKCTDEA